MLGTIVNVSTICIGTIIGCVVKKGIKQEYQDALMNAMGIVMGNILPHRIVSALSVALFGMFLAIFIPPVKTSKPIAILVVLSFLFSFLLSRFTPLSESAITIVLTIAISGFGALVFPTKGKNQND